MQLSEYQRAAKTTAVFPAAHCIHYEAMGLCGEVGELANKAKKILRGDVTLEARIPEIIPELGDAMWYVAGMATALHVGLGSLFDEQDLAFTPPYPDIHQTIMLMNSHAGSIIGHAAVTRRDGINTHRREIMLDSLRQLLKLAVVLAGQLGTNIEEVCEANIRKLLGRKERGTILGDGDKR